jgi:UDP-N-acetylglucosamine--N-acetylmuramyl-(pentapeptide) pyrophosphoryl-undecaprenol N-acetylglucosamine transferase
VNVIFAGGGSGGHLYPALAIARAMVAANPSIDPFFIGAKRGIEREILPVSEFPFELLELHPLYRSQPWMNWLTLTRSTGSWRRIGKIMRDRNPRVLVATGGYAAGVALAAATARKLPIVIQEQNSFPGLTVRWFASRAKQLHLGFPEALQMLHPGSRTHVFDSGNPIAVPIPREERPSPEALAERWGFSGPPAPTLLVFGGSQGAEGINRIVAEWIPRAEGVVRVIWSTGRANYDKYSRLDGPWARVVPYISPMSDAYAAADLAVSRSGAMTTAELSAWGIPTILVPLPTSAAGHQLANARAIATSGAAIMIQQPALTADLLHATITRLLGDHGALAEMRERTLIRARPHAAQDIAVNILGMDSFK